MSIVRLKRILNSVLWKLIMGFLFVAIPLYAVCFATIWISSNIVTRKVTSSVQSRMNLHAGFLEKEMEDINQMLIALNNDPDLVAYALMQNRKLDYNSVSLKKSIETKMNIIFYSSNYISDVYLWFPYYDRELSLRKGISEIKKEEKDIIEKIEYSNTKLVRFLNNGSLSYVVSFTGDEQTNYLLGVDIDQNKIVEEVKAFENDEAFNVLMLESESKLLVESSSLTYLDKQVYEVVRNADGIEEISYAAVAGKEYLVMVNLIGNQLYQLVSYISVNDMLAPILLVKDLLWIFMGVSILFLIAFSFIVYRQIHTPLKSLVKLMGEVEKGNLGVSFTRKQEDEFGYVYKHCNQMVSQLKTLIREVLEKKIQLQQAQLRQLQSQINPHFLYNCFYIGYRMAKSGENDNVASLCKYLGDYFRFITKQGQGEVSLKDELKFTVTYLEIQKIRFPEKLHFTLNTDSVPDDVMIPGLTMQPLVENSILHGIDHIDGPGFININIINSGDKLLVEISDNGKGMTDSEKAGLSELLKAQKAESGHCGLWNVHWRLCSSYGNASGLNICDNDNRGLKVSFCIPLKHLSKE